MKLYFKKILHKIVDEIWQWCWFHLVSQRIRMNYKYVGYDFWWMFGAVEQLKEETDLNNFTDPMNTYRIGQLDAYESVFDSMKQDCR